MQKIKLGDVLDVKRGASLSGDYYAEEGKYVRLTLGNFNYPGGGFKENTSKSDIYFVGPIKPEFILNEGDIITPLTEQVSGLLGETATIPEGGKYIQSGDVGLVIPDETKLDKRFAYYLIASPIVKKQLDAAAQQTKIRHTSPDAIKACEAWIPEDISVQASIGRLLDSINTKIANNNAICSNLEAMAKLLYDYWFVQFDFPDENGKPYKSSGGKMVWNDELKREIPAGWEVKCISDIGTLDQNSVWPNNDMVYSHYSIPAFDDSHMPVREEGSVIESNKYIIPENCVLVSKLNPQFKRIWLIIKPQENAICSTEFLPIKAGNIGINYLYEVVNSDAFSVHLSQKASSSTGSRKRIDPENCMAFQFASDNRIAKLYNSTVASLIEQANQIPLENQQLASLRDFLLPVLMNGQVKVC